MRSIASAVSVLVVAGLVWIAWAPVVAADPDLEGLEEQAFRQASALVDPSIVRIQTGQEHSTVEEII